MSIWKSKQELQETINAWKAALRAAALGKSYVIGSRTLTRYDLDEIKDMLDWLEDEMEELEGRKGSLKTYARLWR